MMWEKFAGSDGNEFSHLVTDTAFRGPFLLTVNVKGNLDSQQNVTVSSGVEGATTIISIVPEGTRVNAGDVVCVLDGSQLVDQAKQQEILVANVTASEVSAKEALDVQRLQNESDISLAATALRLADLDLRKYKEGEFKKLESELSGNLAIAEEEAIQARESHEFNKRQVKKGFVQQNELESSRILVQQKNLAVDKASEELKVLREFDSVRTLAELTSNASELLRELERVKLKAAAAEVQAEQEFVAAQKSAVLEREKLAKLTAQVAKCTLTAPQAGEVVYANFSKRGRGGDGPAIEEGATVQERQEIFHLPDVSKMKVDARVHESLISNISEGLPAKIELDSRHGQTFKGIVAHISSVPMSGSWPNYDLREYEVKINITDVGPQVETLKPGLTAQVEIFVDSRNGVLQVPLQSVVGIVGHYYAWVLTADGPEQRELKVGQTNDTDVEILDGVAEGERVILNPRTNFAEKIAELTTLLSAESTQNDAEENVIPEGTPAPSGPSASSASPGDQPSERKGGGNVEGMFAKMDADKDGKLSGDEIPSQMQGRLSDIDTDSDGAISKAELTAAMKKSRGSGGRGGAGGPSGGPSGGAGD